MKDFTVKDIADLLKVSKTTVQKYIKTASIQYDYIERNKQFYGPEKAKEIIKSIKPEFDLSELGFANSQEETENSKTETENSKTETENSKEKLEKSQTESENSQEKTANSEISADATQRMLDMLQQEIEKKDKMITDLQEKLDKAYDKIADMADKAQYITAADKTAQLMDKQQKKEDTEIVSAAAPDPEAPEEKKSFFAKIFGRK